MLGRAGSMVCMYVPAHFAATDTEVQTLLSSMTAIDLISTGPDGLVATFLPMLWDEASSPIAPLLTRSSVDAHSHKGSLVGHVARNNPHWQCAGPGTLAIVRGPDAYVSPSWYASKAEHGRVVPTWNYLTAHVYGRLVAHDDVAWLRSLVTKLTERHEAAVGSGWQVSDAPSPYIDGQLRAIVGVELVIERVEAKSKLSQNRSEADQAGVVEGLGPSSQVGALISQNLRS
jgi:transcriptional regulator